MDVFKINAEKKVITLQLCRKISSKNTAAIKNILYGEGDTVYRDTNFLVGITINTIQEQLNETFAHLNVR